MGEARRRKLASTELTEDKASRNSIGDFISLARQQAGKTGRLSALEIVHHIEARIF